MLFNSEHVPFEHNRIEAIYVFEIGKKKCRNEEIQWKMMKKKINGIISSSKINLAMCGLKKGFAQHFHQFHSFATASTEQTKKN